MAPVAGPALAELWECGRGGRGAKGARGALGPGGVVTFFPALTGTGIHLE